MSGSTRRVLRPTVRTADLIVVIKDGPIVEPGTLPDQEGPVARP